MNVLNSMGRSCRSAISKTLITPRHPVRCAANRRIEFGCRKICRRLALQFNIFATARQLMSRESAISFTPRAFVGEIRQHRAKIAEVQQRQRAIIQI
jgi:hypothetical protein